VVAAVAVAVVFGLELLELLAARACRLDSKTRTPAAVAAAAELSWRSCWAPMRCRRLVL
jgi:hypothetical protein